MHFLLASLIGNSYAFLNASLTVAAIMADKFFELSNQINQFAFSSARAY